MEELFKKLDITPQNLKLYITAFNHSSYVNEHKLKADYERLEFLGDAVVDLVVADYLYENHNYKEGDMTKIRASYVCENALSMIAIDFNLNNYIKVGNGEKASGGSLKKAILADTFEALMGAIYLDLGYAKAYKILLKIIVPYIENKSISFFEDYKSKLQEYAQTEQKSCFYDLIKEEGPAHDKKFTMDVRIDDVVLGTGSGNTKKEAEQQAAASALSKLAVK